MVKSMMATKRVPLDKLNQDKQILQWQREGYREFNSLLYDFRSNKLGLSGYGASSALNANKASVGGNLTAVKADALSTANNVEMKVSVRQLATKTTYSTSGLGQGVPASSSLAQLDGVELSAMSEEDRTAYLNKGFYITINGETFTDKEGNSLFNGMTSISTLVSTINTNAKANAVATYDEVTGKLSIASKTGGEKGEIIISTPTSAGETSKEVNSLIALFSKKTETQTKGLGEAVSASLTLADLQEMTSPLDETATDEEKAKEKALRPAVYVFSINGKSFSFAKDTKIEDMITEINNSNDPDKGANVTVTLDEATGKLSIQHDTAGGEVKLAGNSYGLLKLFGGAETYTEKPGAITKTKDGHDAVVFVNGEKLQNTNSNVVTINGVQLTLQEVTVTTTDFTSSEITGDNRAIINTQTDPDKVLETVKGFIKDYNDLIGKLNAKMDEVRYRDFAPLTDEQKAEMKESEITAWTEKAKSGLFKNNDIIGKVLSDMRSVITEQLGPLSTLGITTGNYMEKGKLVLDENKLRTALNNNPQLAIDLFQGPPHAPDQGLFDKLNAKISGALDEISSRAGTNRFSMDLSSTFKEESVMGKKLKQYNDRIFLLQRNLSNLENRYYKQFAAMETAMNRLSTQASSLLTSMGYTQ